MNLKTSTVLSDIDWYSCKVNTCIRICRIQPSDLDTTLGHSLRHEAVLNRIYIDVIVQILRGVTRSCGCRGGSHNAHHASSTSHQKTWAWVVWLLVVRVVVELLLLVVMPVQCGGVSRSAWHPTPRWMMQAPAGISVQYVATAASESRWQCAHSATVRRLQVSCQSGRRR